MNILIVFKSPVVPFTGGVQRVTDILGKEFQKNGHEVTYLSYGHPEMMDYADFSAPQLYYPVKKKTQDIIRQELGKIIEERSISHIIFQVYTKETLLIAKCLPNNLKEKIVFSSHLIPFGIDSITRKRIFSAKANNFKQFIFKLASTICPSIKINYGINEEKQLLRDAFSYNARYCFLSKSYFDKVLRYLPNAPIDRFIAICNPNTFSTLDYTLDSPEIREKSVMWVGRVEDVQKNIFGFLEVWRIFTKSHPGWSAYVVGDGADLEKCRKYAISHKLNNIHFEGLQKDVSKYYKKCKFLCVTSFWESWGMILTEAMSFGCVPIAMDYFPVLHDIVDDRINGFICGIKPSEMAQTLSEAISLENTYTSISSAARLKIQQYNASLIIKEWVCLLESL